MSRNEYVPASDVVDTYDDAAKLVEVFKARGHQKEKHVRARWPARMQKIGQCLAVEYSSDKWHRNGDFEDYKHIAESVNDGGPPQELLACRDLLRGFGGRRGPLEVHGPMVELIRPMPLHIAELSELLGVQVRLYVSGGKLGQGDEGVMQVRIARCLLGGARHPVTHAPFLFLYSPSREDGIHAIILGSALDIEKDGIVG